MGASVQDVRAAADDRLVWTTPATWVAKLDGSSVGVRIVTPC
jgi:hypothetical protein